MLLSRLPRPARQLRQARLDRDDRGRRLAAHRHLLSPLLASCCTPHGAMLLQAITIDDRAYEVEKASKSFIKEYIFPGGCLPSMEVISRHVARRTDLQTVGLEDITASYVETLRRWRAELRRRGRRARPARLRRALPAAVDAVSRLLRGRVRRAADLRRAAAAGQAAVGGAGQRPGPQRAPQRPRTVSRSKVFYRELIRSAVHSEYLGERPRTRGRRPDWRSRPETPDLMFGKGAFPMDQIDLEAIDADGAIAETTRPPRGGRLRRHPHELPAQGRDGRRSRPSAAARSSARSLPGPRWPPAKGASAGRLRQGRHRHPQLRADARVPRVRVLQRGARRTTSPRATRCSLPFLKTTRQGRERARRVPQEGARQAPPSRSRSSTSARPSPTRRRSPRRRTCWRTPACTPTSARPATSRTRHTCWRPRRS